MLRHTQRERERASAREKKAEVTHRMNNPFTEPQSSKKKSIFAVYCFCQSSNETEMPNRGHKESETKAKKWNTNNTNNNKITKRTNRRKKNTSFHLYTCAHGIYWRPDLRFVFISILSSLLAVVIRQSLATFGRRLNLSVCAFFLYLLPLLLKFSVLLSNRIEHIIIFDIRHKYTHTPSGESIERQRIYF